MPIQDVNVSTADIQGNIIDIGSNNVAQHGHCWSTSSNPTTSNSKTTLGSTSVTGNFTSNLTNLTQNVTYYARAYATNSEGTNYSDEISFATGSYTLATVTTGNSSNINFTAFDISGNIIDLGNTSVTQYGHCWSTSTNPTTSDSKTTLGTGSTGNFSSSVTSLQQNITYYVRAYVTNSAGTSYGDQVAVQTLAPSVPTVTTTSPTNTPGSTAICGGDITFDGGSSISAKGVCWSTSPTPTLSNNYTTDGSGMGSFTSTISDLDLLTTYYVRAYATNSLGTSYGNEISFTAELQIGTFYAGGVVFWIDETGYHGLVCAVSDQGTYNEWGCNYTTSGATGTLIGTGLQNTIDIVAICSQGNRAAIICYNLVLEGYSDWFLPSADELNAMYINRGIINTTATNHGGTNFEASGGATSNYWSSSEYSSISAYNQDFYNGNRYTKYKDSNIYIRAIRSF